MSNSVEIIAFHLYNDFSGSPRVLSTVLDGLSKDGYAITLLTSKNGILDSVINNSSIHTKHIPYNFYSKSKIKTITSFISANLKYLCYILLYNKTRKPTIYVNTIMPWGAALGAKIRNFKLIYHYHENAKAKGRIYLFLTRIMERLADSIICVSQTQKETLNRKQNVEVIYNGVDNSILGKLHPSPNDGYFRKNILMLSSLKGYKGIYEFCELAKMLPKYNFSLVINDTEENCEVFKRENNCHVIKNLTIYSKSNDVAKFYNQASVVLNLSDANQFIETFGLTVLEGLSAALPVIVPPIGGPSELVTDGYNGYLADGKNLNLIKEKIEYIFSSPKIYTTLAENAYRSSHKFTNTNMINRIKNIINNE